MCLTKFSQRDIIKCKQNRYSRPFGRGAETFGNFIFKYLFQSGSKEMYYVSNAFIPEAEGSNPSVTNLTK